MWENGEADFSDSDLSKIAVVIADQLSTRPVLSTPNEVEKVLHSVTETRPEPVKS